MAVVIPEQKALSYMTYNRREETEVEKNEPEITTFHDFLSTQSTDAYREKFRPTVRIPWLSCNYDRREL